MLDVRGIAISGRIIVQLVGPHAVDGKHVMVIVLKDTLVVLLLAIVVVVDFILYSVSFLYYNNRKY